MVCDEDSLFQEVLFPNFYVWFKKRQVDVYFPIRQVNLSKSEFLTSILSDNYVEGTHWN